MAMFGQLTQRLQGALRGLRGAAKVDERSFDTMARELRLALLEADVHFQVVKRFLAAVKERALGQDVQGSLTPGQQVIKIVNDELVELLGGESSELRFSGRSPHVVMMVGLQGAGKTTSTGKLGRWLRSRGRSPLLVSVDVQRPAAREQLAIVAQQAGLTAFDPTAAGLAAGLAADAVGLAKAAYAEARRRGDDVLLVDTAGRLHIDAEMMGEAKAIAAAVQPEHILYVGDSLAGQDAVEAATAFGAELELSGHILTKLDGDGRGGAALSIVSVTGAPIYFAGVGEKLEEFEVFHPDRLASRILGMGDVLTLIERVQEQVDVDEAAGLEKRLRRGEFTLEDFGKQLKQMQKMGPLSQLMDLVPGMAGAGMQGMGDAPAVDDREITRVQAIIDSMTPAERRRPKLVNGARRRRIAAGSGTEVQDVNRLLKQYTRAHKLIKKIGKKGGRGMSWANLPGMR